MKTAIACFIIILVISPLDAQPDTTSSDSLKRHPFLKKQIFPLSLITTGSLLNIGEIKYRIHDATPNTNTSVDDYLQYAPMIQMYAFDLAGVKSRNSLFDQTKYLAISQLTTSLIVQALKVTTNVKRPTGGTHSFPSGHTANAFAGATVLYHEFKDSDCLLACSGFVVAASTGFLRMTNDAHWLPDVITSAGIAILVVNTVYYFEPLKNIHIRSKKQNFSVFPAFGYRSFALTCSF